MRELPTGTVSFLFTDIEGSTRLLQELGDDWAAVVRDHHRLLRAAFAAAHGQEVDTQGDAFFAVFGRARDAVDAAVASRRALAAHSWPRGVTVRARVGIHTGEPRLEEEGYLGLDVVRASRVCSAAHGGQIVITAATRELVRGNEPDGVDVLELGEHTLRDIDRPEVLYELADASGGAAHPPLRTDRTKPPAPDWRRQLDAALDLIGDGTKGGWEDRLEVALEKLGADIAQGARESALGIPETSGRTAPALIAGPQQHPPAVARGLKIGIAAIAVLALLAAIGLVALVVWVVQLLT